MVEVRSRTDRRSEKKQSFVFIAFIATVAIVCFASGFMVGRNSASRTVQLAEKNSVRKPITNQTIEKKSVEEKQSAEKLTFYEALPKGEQPPLGSGINLPAKDKIAEKDQVEEVVVKKDDPKTPIPEKVFEVAKVEKPAVKPSPVKEVPRPKVDPETVNYILQVASYPQPDEAGKLLGRLTRGGYDVYVQQADLGSKGTWYRVFVGPVTGKSQAVKLQGKIEKEIKVKPILRKK